MKIKPEDYEHLKSAIALIPRDKALAHKALTLGSDKERRFRWDLLYKARLSPWICDNLYSYLNDSHIDTALKKIVLELSL